MTIDLHTFLGLQKTPWQVVFKLYPFSVSFANSLSGRALIHQYFRDVMGRKALNNFRMTLRQTLEVIVTQHITYDGIISCDCNFHSLKF